MTALIYFRILLFSLFFLLSTTLLSVAKNNYVVFVLNDLDYPGGAAITSVPPGCSPEIGFIDPDQKQKFTCDKKPKKPNAEFLFNVGTPSQTCLYSCNFDKHQKKLYKLSNCSSTCF